MASINLFTYSDALEHVLGYLGANPQSDALIDARRGILAAYREFSAVRRWTYYYQRGRVVTSASYATGTVQYTQSTLTVTLTGGTFPSWAAFGRIFFNNPNTNENNTLPTGNGYISYQVASRTDDTHLVLSVNSNPGVDLDAGTTFTIYRDSYPLPADFLSIERLINFSNLYMSPIYCTPGDWLLRQRVAVPSAIPVWYTVMADPHYFGTMGVAFYPPPDNIYTMDFIYHRRPRPLLIDMYQAGTVTGTNGQTMLTGSGTGWSSRYVGSSIRFSGTAQAPTGLIGSNPFQEERVITAVADGTHLTLDSPLVYSYAGAKYLISDPVDIEEGAMLTAFQRCMEKQESISRVMKIQGNARSAYNEALIKAMEADSRHFERRQAGIQKEGLYDIWIHNTPAGPDIP